MIKVTEETLTFAKPKSTVTSIVKKCFFYWWSGTLLWVLVLQNEKTYSNQPNTEHWSITVIYTSLHPTQPIWRNTRYWHSLLLLCWLKQRLAIEDPAALEIKPSTENLIYEVSLHQNSCAPFIAVVSSCGIISYCWTWKSIPLFISFTYSVLFHVWLA